MSKIIDKTGRFFNEFDKRAQQAVTASCLLVEGDAKLLCPVGQYTDGRVGGKLKGSITHKVDGRVGYVGTPVEYAPHIEYGTQYQSAQPYLRPPLKNRSRDIIKLFKHFGATMK